MTTALAPEPATLRDYLSYSQVASYLLCPLQHGYRYVEGLPETTVRSSLVVGGATHRALEAYHRALMKKKPAPTADELVRPISDAFAEALAEKEICFKKGETRASAQEQALGLVRAYIDQCPIEGKVVGVEERLSVELAPWLQPLVSVIDVMEQIGKTLRITDVKTSSTKWSTAKAEEARLQLALYRLAAQPVADMLGCDLAQRFVVLIKTKVPRVQVIDMEIDDGVVERAKHLATTVSDAVEKKIFYPRPGWQCSGCSFRRECEKWPA